MQEELTDAVLVSLRRIIRATSLYSRRLGKETGLTTAQLVVLRQVENHPGVSVSEIARQISLSQATVTSLVKQLESDELLTKRKATEDKRRIEIALTNRGQRLLASAPMPLQDNFVKRFTELQSWEQHAIVASLERVAGMMDAQKLDAAPMLTGGELAIAEPAVDHLASDPDSLVG